MSDSQAANPTFNTIPQDCVGEFITKSPNETFALGQRVGESLLGGEVLLLTGDLGAGKTVFAKGVASGVGIAPDDVTSPSFTLMNIHEGRLKLHHVDLYRLESKAISDLGLEEILEDPRSVTVIEWADRLAEAPAKSIAIEMQYVSDSDRKITIARDIG